MAEMVVGEDGVARVEVELFVDGLLWYINRIAFHPRGFALAYSAEDGVFELWGNGDEPYRFEGIDEDAKFAAVERVLEMVRRG